MKQVFPGVRPRRLGQRGASKYCYSGLRKKWALDPPSLPDLNDNMTKKNVLGVDCVVDEGEVDRAANCLVLEWAEKLWSVKFESIRDLALHLVHKNYVDNRSMAAFTLLSVADQNQGMLVSGGTGGGKHRETQLQLQRKLQEREHIREQKRKLQEQQPAINKANNERPKSRRRSGASRNPSGETVTNGTSAVSSKSNSHHPPAATITTTITATTNTTNGNCDSLLSELPNGATGDIAGGDGNNIVSITNIKQEESLEFLDSLTDDKLLDAKVVMDGKNGNFHSNIITNVGHTQQPLRRNCNTNNNCDVKTSCNKVPNPKSNPAKKPFLIMQSSAPKTTSPKSRFKAIQPKVTDSMQGTLPVASQWSEILGVPEDITHPKTEVLLPVNYGGQLMVESGIQQRNLPGGQAQGGVGVSAHPLMTDTDIDQDVQGTGGMRRRVSFQPSLDGGDSLNPLMGGQTVGSRHNSNQNHRSPYTPNCRSRHSSGAPTFRHAPYTPDDMSSRRGGKFRSRHSSGSVPPSPSSAPLSPLVQDGSVHPPQDSSIQLPSASMLHHMLKNKQTVSGYSDLRRRHMSAGPTIHYQPQPPAFSIDPLSQEVSNVMTNSQPGPSNALPGNLNRPQSVPPLQMLNMPSCTQESFAKSHPNTPVVNQQFVFTESCVSQPSSYAPTPVPSECNDFTDSYNLEIDPLLDVNLSGDAGGTVGLDSMDSLTLTNSHTADLSTLSDPLQVPPNMDPFSVNYASETGDMRSMEEQIGGPLISTASMLTLNALNRSLENPGSGLEEDFRPTLPDLGDQEVFNSLVLDVNKD
ncbi:DNA-binding protein RFX7 [Penaeus vannamei]|uniref:DNA-binding protein RFX7 n=1 Tax=Penaeus vannamei TaxID=6689 RepID=A0A423U9J9_PENVA|nr:DNA-binding protein RFX7 [Penaeus vannamei]